jgi:hypothetical protein
MKNQSLKRSLDEILKDPQNVVVKKGSISGYSIDVEYQNTSENQSFCYYNNEKERDFDLVNLIGLLKEKYENICK